MCCKVATWCLLAFAVCINGSVPVMSMTLGANVGGLSGTAAIDQTTAAEFGTALTLAGRRSFSLPDAWRDICQVKGFSGYQSKFTNTTLVAVHCSVSPGSSGRWTLADLRQSLEQPEHTGVNLAVDITCTDMSNISLPWPMKVENLYRLRVINCILVDFLSEAKDDIVEDTADSLRELVLRDNTAIISIAHFIEMLQDIKHIHKEFDCGHDDTIERMTIRNMSYTFLESYDLVIDELAGLGEDFILDAKRIQHKCDFKRLVYLEEGHDDSMSTYHMSLLTDNSIFYELRSYNLSHNKIKVLNDAQLRWSVLFPRLETFDLSYNEISRLQPFDVPVHTRTQQVTTINLQHNNISMVTVGELLRFGELPMMFVDLRNNAMNCSCSENMKELVDYINKQYYLNLRVNNNRLNYSYLPELQCSAPRLLHGTRLGSLTPGLLCGEGTIKTDYYLVPIITLSSSMAVLFILSLVLLKYRNEILVILFTRFYIILPCQSRFTDKSNKTFDAFVSYSSNEGEWVEALFDSLERPTESSSPPFNFCMHYRDFIPGKTIFDNVVKSVEASRHTIIILSRNFIKSEFCMYEFQEAFRQSILEQQRHLVIVMADDLAPAELPSDLRRCVKTFTYIEKDSYLFKERLVYALSVRHKTKHRNQSNSRQQHRDIQGSITMSEMPSNSRQSNTSSSASPSVGLRSEDGI